MNKPKTIDVGQSSGVACYMTDIQSIINLRGMCIYGTLDYVDAASDVKEAFRDGSNKAYDECADSAEKAALIINEMVLILKQFCKQYDVMPDGELGKGLTNAPFLKAKDLLKRIAT